MYFETIKSISVDDPSTWRDKLFLTIDVDWIIDDLFEEVIDLIEEIGIKATWFITHKTSLLDRLNNNPNFELGIHPNFNNLLFGGKENRDTEAESIISTMMKIVPNAVSIRSHSLLQSSQINILFKQAGLKYDCNDLIPAISKIALKPWVHWNGMTKVPFFWEDDMALLNRPKKVINIHHLKEIEELKVFNFHPIHLFLNTKDIQDYYNCKTILHSKKKLIRHVNKGVGVRSWLEELVK